MRPARQGGNENGVSAAANDMADMEGWKMQKTGNQAAGKHGIQRDDRPAKRNNASRRPPFVAPQRNDGASAPPLHSAFIRHPPPSIPIKGMSKLRWIKTD